MKFNPRRHHSARFLHRLLHLSNGVQEDNHGFTIVELVVVIGTSALFVTLILFFGMNYWQNAELMGADNDTFVSRLNIQDYVREVIGTTDGLITQNSIPDPNANNPDPISGAYYWIENHAVPGTVSITGSTTIPLLYFRRFSIDTSKNVIMNGTQPFDDEYILYANPATKEILVRTLANPSAPNNRLKTSCPPQNATTLCPADKVIFSDLATITATYYSRSGNTINHQSIVDTDGNYIGPDFPAVEAVQYVFRVTRKPFLQKSNATVNDTIVRIAVRNT